MYTHPISYTRTSNRRETIYGKLKEADYSVDLGYISARVEEIVAGDATIPCIGYQLWEQTESKDSSGNKTLRRLTVNLLRDNYQMILDALKNAPFDQKYVTSQTVPLGGQEFSGGEISATKYFALLQNYLTRLDERAVRWYSGNKT